MVTKKKLENRIKFLETMVSDLNTSLAEAKTIIKEMTEKLEFVYKQNDYDKEQQSIFDEWINGEKGSDN